MIFRVNSITIETRYNSVYNVWFAKVYDSLTCYAKNRRLREGTYEFFSGVIVSIDYQGKNPFNGDCIGDAVINFSAPCLIIEGRGQPCG